MVGSVEGGLRAWISDIQLHGKSSVECTQPSTSFSPNTLLVAVRACKCQFVRTFVSLSPFPITVASAANGGNVLHAASLMHNCRPINNRFVCKEEDPSSPVYLNLAPPKTTPPVQRNRFILISFRWRFCCVVRTSVWYLALLLSLTALFAAQCRKCFTLLPPQMSPALDAA